MNRLSSGPVHLTWLRGAPVALDDQGWVRASDEPTVEGYQPLRYVNLPNVFAKIGSQKSALRFVGLFGRLGFSEAARHLPQQDRTRRMAGEHAGGEPLDWIIAQAQSVRFASLLIEAIQRKDETVIGSVLEQSSDLPLLTGSDPDDEPRVGRFRVAFGAHVELWEPLAAWEERDGRLATLDLATQATGVASELINRNTASVRTEIAITPDGLERAVVPETLLETIWWHVGTWATQGRLKVCKNCGTPFLVTHGRQDFCPGIHASQDAQGHVSSDRSICAAVHSQRLSRQRKAGKPSTSNEARETE